MTVPSILLLATPRELTFAPTMTATRKSTLGQHPRIMTKSLSHISQRRFIGHSYASFLRHALRPPYFVGSSPNQLRSGMERSFPNRGAPYENLLPFGSFGIRICRLPN